jgi:hypothetical protein
MDFELANQQKQIRLAAREFAETEAGNRSVKEGSSWTSI